MNLTNPQNQNPDRMDRGSTAARRGYAIDFAADGILIQVKNEDINTVQDALDMLEAHLAVLKKRQARDAQKTD